MNAQNPSPDTPSLSLHELRRVLRAGERAKAMELLRELVDGTSDEATLNQAGSIARSSGLSRGWALVLRRLADLGGGEGNAQRAELTESQLERDGRAKMTAIVSMLRDHDLAGARNAIADGRHGDPDNAIWDLLEGEADLRDGNSVDAIKRIESCAAHVDDGAQVRRLSNVTASANATGATLALLQRLAELESDDEAVLARLEKLRTRAAGAVQRYQNAIVRHLRADELSDAAEQLQTARLEYPSEPIWYLLGAELLVRKEEPGKAADMLFIGLPAIDHAAQVRRVTNVAAKHEALEVAALLAERLANLLPDDEEAAVRAERLNTRLQAARTKVRSGALAAVREDNLDEAERILAEGTARFRHLPEATVVAAIIAAKRGDPAPALPALNAHVSEVDDAAFLKRSLNALTTARSDELAVVVAERLHLMDPDDADMLQRLLCIEGRLMQR